MAPEQTCPGDQPISTFADIYSLGAILYELLTSKPPIEAKSLAQLRELQRKAEIRAPREHAPHIPRDLEAICLKCLHKNPNMRYQSAAELADDLELYLADKPTKALPAGLLRSGWMRCRRHPLWMGFLGSLLLLVLVVAVGAVPTLHAQDEDLRSDALRSNIYAARLVAGAVLFELAQYRHGLQSLAAQPELVAALQARDPTALESFCRDGFTYHDGPRGGYKSSKLGSPFEVCFIMDTAGTVLGRWSQPQRDILNKNFVWRDYFQGAKRLAEGKHRAAYVSRAFKSETDGKYAFALAAPVYAADGTWLGVLAATVATGSKLGLLQLEEPGDSSRTATLVALTDRMRGEVEMPGRDVYAVLVHERLERGKQAKLEPHTAQQLMKALPEPSLHGQEQLQPSEFGGQELAGYRDPVLNESDTWLAAFAPVGHTGFTVVVQTREKAVLAVKERLEHRIAPWLLLLFVGLLVIWGACGWAYYLRSSQEKRAYA